MSNLQNQSVAGAPSVPPEVWLSREDFRRWATGPRRCDTLAAPEVPDLPDHRPVQLRKQLSTSIAGALEAVPSPDSVPGDFHVAFRVERRAMALVSEVAHGRGMPVRAVDGHFVTRRAWDRAAAEGVAKALRRPVIDAWTVQRGENP